MRGQTRQTLLQKLKQEIRDSQTANTIADVEYHLALVSKQNELCSDYDWPFLTQRWPLSLGASAQFAAIPTTNDRGATTTINFERPVLVEVKYNNRYQEVGYGIGSEQYNTRNPDLNETRDPVSRWAFSTNVNEPANANQIEVWPKTASAQTLLFTAQRQPQAVTADGHTFDLDDYLIVYMVAADYLAFRQQPNAPLVLRKAQQRLIKLRASYATESDPIVFGRSNSQPKIKPVSIVTVA